MKLSELREQYKTRETPSRDSEGPPRAPKQPPSLFDSLDLNRAVPEQLRTLDGLVGAAFDPVGGFSGREAEIADMIRGTARLHFGWPPDTYVSHNGTEISQSIASEGTEHHARFLIGCGQIRNSLNDVHTGEAWVTARVGISGIELDYHIDGFSAKDITVSFGGGRLGD